jgi:hypothetical protein
VAPTASPTPRLCRSAPIRYTRSTPVTPDSAASGARADRRPMLSIAEMYAADKYA